MNHAPLGGWIVLPVVDGKSGYIIGTIAGSVTTASIVIALKKTVTEDESYTGHSQVYGSVQGEGEADVLAVTSCPSGVAHTFLAAKSLEKAACALGIKIKVETQGANGVINRITEKDIEKAKFVIFAHDVAIKEPERFRKIKVLDVTTKDAMLNAAALLQARRVS
ncbi:PTS fructose transporter subunit IIB, partial [Vibrio sp. 1579]|uniref:PTS fructose transporter subunit IIB n=1 Tax=Vibrio sp. 1579 TaxID=3074566 RepID=UPI00296444A3